MIRPLKYLSLLILLSSCQEEINQDVALKDVTDTEFIAELIENGNLISPLTATINTISRYEHTVQITIRGKQENDLTYTKRELSKTHNIPLIGLYPGYTNVVDIKAYNASNQLVASREFEFLTDSLNIRFPKIEILHFDSVRLKERLSFVEYRVGINNIPFIYDQYGDIRWCLVYPEQSLVRPTILTNTQEFFCGDFGYEVFYRYDWLGNGDTIALPAGFKQLHHDIHQYDDHLFFPADKDYVLECDTNGNLIRSWNLAEIFKRYLPANQDIVKDGKDWLHVNSVFYQEADNSLIISARQSAGIFKIDYASGNIRWILSDTTMLWYSYPALRKLALQPAPGCELPLGQHSPVALEKGRMLVLDNGYDGYERLDNQDGLISGGKGYSRLVVYRIDEQSMTAEQEFEYGRKQKRELFSRFAGSAGYDEKTDTYYGTFGNIVFQKGAPVTGRQIEVGSDGTLLFDARLTSLKTVEMFFRGEKINLNDVVNESK